MTWNCHRHLNLRISKTERTPAPPRPTLPGYWSQRHSSPRAPVPAPILPASASTLVASELQALSGSPLV